MRAATTGDRPPARGQLVRFAPVHTGPDHSSEPAGQHNCAGGQASDGIGNWITLRTQRMPSVSVFARQVVSWAMLAPPLLLPPSLSSFLFSFPAVNGALCRRRGCKGRTCRRIRAHAARRDESTRTYNTCPRRALFALAAVLSTNEERRKEKRRYMGETKASACALLTLLFQLARGVAAMMYCTALLPARTDFRRRPWEAQQCSVVFAA